MHSTHSADERQFKGPLFLVGMVRSGTKLLRDLLNQNLDIGIPISESHFIPYMIERFGNPPDFGQKDQVDIFFDELTRTNFYWNERRMGHILQKQDLLSHPTNVMDFTSWGPIFEQILRFCAPDGRNPNFIWGDKTPIYLRHLPLLQEIYPAARFLHIIRDPRDYCLSVRKSWGKSTQRAAHDWQATLRQVMQTKKALGMNYLEVRYEAPVENPEEVLKTICGFLECGFVPEMLSLNRNTENLGDTQGRFDVVTTNAYKYRTEMTHAEIARIEEIVYSVATELGYTMEIATGPRTLPPLMLNMHTLYDMAASIRFQVKQKGIRAGIRGGSF
ncbi:sulfotransferase [Chloroflexi bacterium TSY]|nr:sulfotransferase [Chloroflexi bacterium TSY]